ncbi:MAG: hypothetical protein AAF623_10740 [Planctomycetota bacterium]
MVSWKKSIWQLNRLAATILCALLFFQVSHAQNISDRDQEEAIAEIPTWPRPRNLITQIEKTGDQTGILGWDQRTIDILEAIGQTPMNDQGLAEQFDILKNQADSLQSAAFQLWGQQSSEAVETASRLLRLHYQIIRRLEIWSQVLPLAESVNLSLSDSQFQFDGVDLSLPFLDDQWTEYLLIRELEKTIADDASDEETIRAAARNFLGRLTSPILNPQQKQYLDQAVDYQTIEKIKTLAREDVDLTDLLKRIEQYDSLPSSYFGSFLNDQYQNLRWSNDPTQQDLSNLIDQHYRNANVRFSVSERLINRLIPALPTLTQPVTDRVEGATITGTSQTSNQIYINLLPDDSSARFQLETTGMVFSDTVADKEPFQVATQGTASFQVYKTVSWSPQGIDASAQPFSYTDGTQQVQDIRSNFDNLPLAGKVARKLAEKKLEKDADKNDQIFRDKVSKSATRRVEDEVLKQLNKFRSNAQKNLFYKLIAMQLEPKALHMSSTDNQVAIRYRFAGHEQMAANTARPDDNGQNLLSYQIHQSAINNAVARFGLNGKTFDSNELKDHLTNYFPGQGKNNLAGEEVEPESDLETAYFTFPNHDPIRFDFKDNRIFVVLNLSSLKIGESGKTYRNLILTTAYQIIPDGMNLSIQQDRDGTSIRGRRLNIGDKATISTLLKKVFRQEYKARALPPKMYDRVQGDQLAVTELILVDGWLSIMVNDAPLIRSSSVLPAYQFGDQPTRFR